MYSSLELEKSELQRRLKRSTVKTGPFRLLRSTQSAVFRLAAFHSETRWFRLIRYKQFHMLYKANEAWPRIVAATSCLLLQVRREAQRDDFISKIFVK